MGNVKVAVRSRGTVIDGVRITKYDTMEVVIEKYIKAWRKKTPFRFSEFAREIETRFGIKVTFEAFCGITAFCENVNKARHEYIFAYIGGRRYVYRIYNVIWVEDKKDDPIIAHYSHVERVNTPA
jgi:hypothetical protein